MQKQTKIVSLLLIIIVLFLTSWAIVTKKESPEEHKELASIRLPIDIWPGNFWVIIADKMGYFEEEGLKTELIDVSATYSETVEEFIEGNLLDTQNLAVFDLIEANINGADLVAVFVSDSSEGAEGLVAKKEFKELSDLRGKRIGVETGSYLDYFLEAAMLNANIDASEYIEVNIPTDDLVSRFEEEELDAAFSWEPDLTKLKEDYDLHTLFSTSDIRGLSPGIFAFHRDFIENRPQDLQALVNAWNKATNFILKNKEEAHRIISEFDFADDPGLYYSPEEIGELSTLDPIQDLEDNLKAFGFETGFESLHGNFQFVSRFIQKTQGLQNIISTNHMLTDQFIRNIK